MERAECRARRAAVIRRPEAQLLLEVQLRPAAKELAGDLLDERGSSLRHCCPADKASLCQPGPAKRAARPSNAVRMMRDAGQSWRQIAARWA